MRSEPVSAAAGAAHYRWGDGCDGWHLVRRDDLSVIQETVPPGAGETSHLHILARQFFFVLEGNATMEIGETTVRLRAEEGVEIPPGMPHRLFNEGNQPLRFLVISMPKSHGDRHPIP
jgi:mannose-6-phosphate isomerase-like protein (cupin superfamily)